MLSANQNGFYSISSAGNAPMALPGPERIPLMNILHIRNRVLAPVVIAALLLSFTLSFTFAGTASAAPQDCVFQAVSTATFHTVGGSTSGMLPPLTGQVTKYTDGCGREFGTLAVSGFSFGFTSFSAGVLINPVRVWTSTNNIPSYNTTVFLSTPVVVGDGTACGYVTFTVYQGSGQGSGCTPS